MPADLRPVERILMVRTSALGDVVHVLPALTALRRAFPRARLAWVVEGAMAPVLEGHPDLDELIVARTRVWRRLPLARKTRSEIRDFLRRLRGFDADVALDLMGNHKAGVIARLSGAKRRIGLAREFRREPSSSVWINERVRPRGVHAVDHALAVAGALGAALDEVDFAGDKLFSRTDPAAEETTPERSGSFVLIHPGAGWGSKTYPSDGWGEVAWRLHREAGIDCRVAVAPGEEEIAREVVDCSRGAAQIVPAGDLAGLASLARKASLVLGGDTGPIHLSHALGTPVLCLMGPTDPERHGPYGSPESILSLRLPCSYCYRRFDDPKACLLSLAPARVAEIALRILGLDRG